MLGKNVGFVKLLENWLQRPLLSFYCVSMFSFIISLDRMGETDIDLTYFKFLNINNFALELINFSSLGIWQEKFKELRVELEGTEANNLNLIAKLLVFTSTKILMHKKKLDLLCCLLLVLAIFVSKYF